MKVSLIVLIFMSLLAPRTLFGKLEKLEVRTEGRKRERMSPLVPMLWKISGHKLKKDSYIFGKLDNGIGVLELHPTVRKHLGEADAVAIEFDLSTKGHLESAKAMIRNDGKSLKKSVGKDLFERFGVQLKGLSSSLSPGPFNRFKTWVAASIVPTMRAQMKGVPVIDAEFAQETQEAGKELWTLETSKEGLVSHYEKLSEEEQKLLFASTIESLEKENELGAILSDGFQKGYLLGDEKAVLKIFLESFESKSKYKGLKAKIFKNIYLERNKILAKAIEEGLRDRSDQSCFISVGILNFLGKGSIRELLSKKGFVIEKVQN